MLRTQYFHDCLDHQIRGADALGQGRRVRQPGDRTPPETLASIAFIAVRTFGILPEVVLDIGARFGSQCGGQLDDGDVESVYGGDFGDAGAHETAANHRHVSNCCHCGVAQENVCLIVPVGICTD